MNGRCKLVIPVEEYDGILYKRDIGYHKKVFLDEPFSIDPIYEAKSILWYKKELEEGRLCKEDKTLIWIVGNQREMY